MATVITKIVDPDNGTGTDYLSLDAWNTAKGGATNGELDNNDEEVAANCRSSSGSADTVKVNIGTFDSDATHRVIINGNADNNITPGVWDSGNYRLSYNGADELIEFDKTYYTLFRNVQIEVGSSYTGGEIIYLTADLDAAGSIWIENCIVKVHASLATTFYGIRQNDVFWSSYISNCIFYGNTGTVATSSAIAFYASNGASARLYNCTADGGGYGYRCWDKTWLYLYNCIGSGSYYNTSINGLYTGNGDYNCSDGTIPTGTHNIESTDPTYAAAGNYNLASGDTSGCKTGGVDLSSDTYYPISTDITGATRSGSWSIGAFQYISAQTFNESCSDGVKYSEAVAAALTLYAAITDGLKASDPTTVEAVFSTLISDAVNYGDLSTSNLLLQALAGSGVSLSDASSRTAIFNAISSSGILGADYQDKTVSFEASDAEGVTLADIVALNAILQALASEGLTLTDLSLASIIATLLANDGIDVSDSTVVAAIYAAITSDELRAGDSVSALAILEGALSDGFSLSDSVTAELLQLFVDYCSSGTVFGDEVSILSELISAISTGVLYSDASTVLAALQSIFSDSLVLSDSTTAELLFLFEALSSDLVRLSDTTIVEATFAAAISDAIKLGDAGYILAAYQAAITDGAILADSALAEIFSLLTSSSVDAAFFADSTLGTAILNALAADSPVLSDIASGGLVKIATTGEIKVYSDLTSGILESLRTAQDGIIFSDSALAEAVLIATATSSLQVSDTSGGSLNLYVSILDGFSIGENVIGLNLTYLATGKVCLSITLKKPDAAYTLKTPGASATLKKPLINFTLKKCNS